METTKNIVKLLPKFNCGACGYPNCYSFAQKLQSNPQLLPDCTVLAQDGFKHNRQKIELMLESSSFCRDPRIFGLIDNMEADFILHPLANEPSCRETLAFFSSCIVNKGVLVRYRPLGCPITHFSRVIEVDHGLLDVWVEGPCMRLGREVAVVELGICLILSFQGTIEGALPNVGQTVKFLPDKCMMGKVHSGIIVQIEDQHVRIDCIDLKVWEHAANNH